MKIRKICGLFLAMTIVLSLCACGSSHSGIQTVSEGPAVSGTTTAPESAAEPTPATESESEESFSFGTTVKNTYINEFFGIGLTLDENWTFSTQEEINEAKEFVLDTLDGEVDTQARDSGLVYTDMMATGDGGIVSVHASIERLNAVSAIAINEDSFLDLFLERNDVRDLLGQLGLDVTVVEKGRIEIAGAEHPCIIIEGTIQGVAFYEKVVAIKSGSYVMSVTASALMENVVDGIFAYFYAV